MVSFGTSRRLRWRTGGLRGGGNHGFRRCLELTRNFPADDALVVNVDQRNPRNCPRQQSPDKTNRPRRSSAKGQGAASGLLQPRHTDVSAAALPGPWSGATTCVDCWFQIRQFNSHPPSGQPEPPRGTENLRHIRIGMLDRCPARQPNKGLGTNATHRIATSASKAATSSKMMGAAVVAAWIPMTLAISITSTISSMVAP